MNWIYTLLYLYIFVLGVVIGSFMNVVIYRVPLGISVAKGRSFCPKCNHSLTTLELIPIFSFLFLGRKCKVCKEPISWRYPLIELISGLLALLSVYIFGFHFQALFTFAFMMILLAVTMIDFDTMTIPNGLILFLIPLAVFSVLLFPDVNFASRVIGFFVISLPMYLLCLIIPNAFGGGDIKLIAVCGFILGISNTLLSFFISLLIGGSYGIYLILTKKKDKTDHIAYGPYLCVGIICAFLWGNVIINLYLSLFNL